MEEGVGLQRLSPRVVGIKLLYLHKSNELPQKKYKKKLQNTTTFYIFAPMKRKILTYGGNIYRVFFIFDDGQIVVLFNGFQKKAQKTPANEIEKAIKIKEAYYADKQSQNR